MTSSPSSEEDDAPLLWLGSSRALKKIGLIPVLSGKIGSRPFFLGAGGGDTELPASLACGEGVRTWRGGVAAWWGRLSLIRATRAASLSQRGMIDVFWRLIAAEQEPERVWVILLYGEGGRGGRFGEMMWNRKDGSARKDV